MTRVKICGLKRARDVDAAVSAGVDATGFIVGFPRSPRNLSLDEAGDLIKHVPPFVSSVLVASLDVVQRRLDRIREIGPSSIQLYGDPDIALVRRSRGLPIIKVLSISRGLSPRIGPELQRYAAILTDTYRRGYDGGTGLTADWDACSRVREAVRPTPMILSGGLNPENVGDAIERVRPFAVDVSSGVESSPGRKDARKMEEFVRRVNEASD